jgi:SAM-dependent methyltransferase
LGDFGAASTVTAAGRRQRYRDGAVSDHPLHAVAYDRCMARAEARGLRERRRQLLAAASGRVLDIGAGTGLNLEHYRPGAVSEVDILEPDGAMARRLRARAATAAVPCTVHNVGVEEAGFADHSFDTVVSTLVLCTVPDLDGTGRRLRRWLAEGGQLLFLEHVVGVGWRARLRRGVAPLWSLGAAGCRLDRDTIAALRHVGLFVGECERFALPAGGPLLSECMAGVARPALGHAYAGPLVS